MKKLIFLFSILAITIGMSSCQSVAEQKLKKAIEQANKSCPLDMGMVGQITSMKYDSDTKYVINTVLTDEDVVDLVYLNENKNEAVSAMKLALDQNEDTRKMLKLMTEAGAGMTYIYEGNLSGTICEVSLSPEEIKDLYENPVSEDVKYKMIIKTAVENEGSRCPYTIDEGLEMVSVEDDGENVIYTCSADEELFDMDLMESMKGDLKGSIAETLNDLSAQDFIKALRQENHGIIYRYVGNKTGKQVDIVFDNDDLWQY